jgi:hypothetical protein
MPQLSRLTGRHQRPGRQPRVPGSPASIRPGSPAPIRW